MPRALHGVLPIVQTPFLDDDRIDGPALQRAIDWAFAVGADGLGTGMVSETLKLSADERRELVERMVDAARGRGATFAAVGADTSAMAAEFARHAERAGCDAVMAAPPTAAHWSAAQLVDFYRQIADAVAIPLIVQDASGYIGQSIPLDVYLQLLARYGAEKIVFKPEAAPIGPNLSALRDATGSRAKIFEGSGGILLIDSDRRGIAGTMPGLDLLDGVVAVWRALRRGDDDAAYAVYFPICAIVALQMQAGLDGFLAIEKYLLVKRGLWTSARRRAPYAWSLDDETAREVDRLFARLQSALARFPG